MLLSFLERKEEEEIIDTCYVIKIHQNKFAGGMKRSCERKGKNEKMMVDLALKLKL